MAEQAPVVYGKYQLLELLARGGMAEVFKAKAHGVEGFEKILVIKRILAELGENPQFVEMFINEAKIAVTLSHANIVQVFDLGKADETYFIAMEYVAGADLATVLRRARKYGKALPTELAVYVVSEVAKGLDYAHRRRDADMQPMHIVHRDVSPQNVLLSYEGEVKLTDFGIAKARTTVPEGTEHGVLKGKYAYMAPEQARGGQVDARTDLFALGVVLYESLAGVNPFLQSSTYDTLKRVREGTAEPIRSVAEEVPEELAAIVHRAMSPSPADRHENAGRFYEDLIQFLYSSGRRVGAHDLSNYLDQLRAAAKAPGPKSETDAGLRAAFEISTSSGRPDPQELTPAEVPSARSGAGRITTGSGRRRTGTGVGPPVERRDVTALVLSGGDADELAGHIERAAGEVVTRERDRVVGLFGRKDPDGRDTERAVRVALLAVRGSAGSRDRIVSAALHAGRILVSAEGELEEDESHARLLRIVRALADRAEAGQVLSTASAQRVARRFFDLRASGEAPEDAGEAYEVLGERNLTDSLGRFVGRREELRRVGEVLAIANKGRQCLLSLVGEAGSGKSRLLSETMRRLRLGGHDVGMHVCRVPPASKDVPLATAQEMLRVLLGIEEFDEEEEIVEKIGRLRELGMSKPELEAVTLALGLSVEDDEHGGRRPLRAAIARIALKLSEDRLSVFAFDDFDGVDEESLQLLDALVRRPAPSRIVILVAHRPDGRIDWSDVPNYHEVRLGPLSDEDVARLTGARLGAEEVPMELLREVRAKSAGNPLYVEEYLLALQDADAIDLKDGRLVYAPDTAVDIPRSLRGIVAARLSRLAPSHKQVLQVAAVIGGRFHDAMVARVIEAPVEEASEALEALVGRGLLARTGAREYGFAHGLIADVVTGTVPFEAKKELHRAIGEAFEAVYPDHLDELAERLAHHYREGGRRERAIDFLVRAADRLESEQSLGGAIGYLRRALEMLLQGAQPDRDRLLGLYRRVVQLCFRARELEQGLEVVEHALEMAEGLGRDEHVARFSLYKGQLCAFMNRFSEAQQWFERARQVARSVGNPDLLRLVTAAHAEAHTRNGEYGRAIGLLREALELARQANDVQAQIRCLIPLAHSYGGSGDRDAALAALEEARELAGDTPDRIIEVELLKTEALVRYYVGDLRIGLEAAHRGMELGKEYGFAYEAAVNAHNLGEFHLRLGDYKRAFAMLRYSYDVARDHGFVKLQYGNMRVLGFIDAVKLGSEEGRAKIIEAWNYARENGYVWDLVQARYMLAIVDHAQGHHEDGRTGLREVLQLAGEYGMQHYERAAEEALAAIEAGLPVPMPS